MDGIDLISAKFTPGTQGQSPTNVIPSRGLGGVCGAGKSGGVGEMEAGLGTAAPTMLTLLAARLSLSCGALAVLGKIAFFKGSHLTSHDWRATFIWSSVKCW